MPTPFTFVSWAVIVKPLGTAGYRGKRQQYIYFGRFCILPPSAQRMVALDGAYTVTWYAVEGTGSPSQSYYTRLLSQRESLACAKTAPAWSGLLLCNDTE